MKRILCCFICFALAVSLAGCKDEPSLISGNYFAVGDYEHYATPYLYLDVDNNEFSLCQGALFSYDESGKYAVKGGKLIAKSESMRFEFEIKDNKTLTLINNGKEEYFKDMINSQFVFSEEFK